MRVCLSITYLIVFISLLSFAEESQSLSENNPNSRKSRSALAGSSKRKIYKNVKGNLKIKKNTEKIRNNNKKLKTNHRQNKNEQKSNNRIKAIKIKQNTKKKNGSGKKNNNEKRNGNKKRNDIKQRSKDENKGKKKNVNNGSKGKIGEQIKKIKNKCNGKEKCMERMKEKIRNKIRKNRKNGAEDKPKIDEEGKLFCADCPVCPGNNMGGWKFAREVINSDLCPVCPSCTESPDNMPCPACPDCTDPPPPCPPVNGGDDSCVGTVYTIMKLIKDKVQNFDKVVARTDNQIKIAMNKADKSDIFQPVAETIITTGGGNSSNLTCDSGTTAADTLTTLMTTLSACNESVQMACKMGFPMLNMSIVDDCKNITMMFKDAVAECSGGKKQSDCTCWTSKKLKDLTAHVRDCTVSGKEIKDALNECKDVFGKCRVAEDDAVSAIAACSVDTTALTAKAKNLARNNASLNSALDKLNELTESSNGSYRIRRQSDTTYITTCTDLISNVTYLLTLDTDSYQVSQTANVIAATSVTASDCSSTYRQTSQLTQLTTLTVSVTTYTATVSSTLTAVQTLLVTATGSSVSASDVPTATTVSTRLRDKRKYQNFHAMANHR